MSFEDAKSTLHSMFPSMDLETIGEIVSSATRPFFCETGTKSMTNFYMHGDS